MKTKIAIVGEAYGEEEERQRMPFVGGSGRLLTQLLEEAGIVRGECFLTNVFALRPKPSNDISNLCCSKKESTLPYPPLSMGNYLRAEYWSEVERLYAELAEVRPNLVVAVGNTPMWALTFKTGISKLRGTITASAAPAPEGLKILPTYHPAALMRDEKLKPIVVMDLLKAKRQAEFPEIRRPKRSIWVEPEIATLHAFYKEHLVNAQSIAFDIETAGDQITCIGFAPNERVAIVCPFTDNRKKTGSYWATSSEEVQAWEWVRKVLQLPCTKIAQNGLYDINWLWTKVGMTPKGRLEDTMLLHHALQPQAPKGLGFLGSCYTDEPAWKTMRGKGLFTLKRED